MHTIKRSVGRSRIASRRPIPDRGQTARTGREGKVYVWQWWKEWQVKSNGVYAAFQQARSAFRFYCAVVW